MRHSSPVTWGCLICAAGARSLCSRDCRRAAAVELAENLLRQHELRRHIHASYTARRWRHVLDRRLHQLATRASDELPGLVARADQLQEAITQASHVAHAVMVFASDGAAQPALVGPA